MVSGSAVNPEVDIDVSDADSTAVDSGPTI